MTSTRLPVASTASTSPLTPLISTDLPRLILPFHVKSVSVCARACAAKPPANQARIPRTVHIRRIAPPPSRSGWMGLPPDWLKAIPRVRTGIIRALDLNLDPTWLFLSLFPGGIGFVLMVYGKKQERWIHVLFGAMFTVYPFFTESATMLVLVGVALGVGL